MKRSMNRSIVSLCAGLVIASFAASVYAGGSAVAVSDVKAEWKKKVGADKDKDWLKLNFTATMVEKVEKFVYPKIKVTCVAGSETITDEITSMTTKFHEMEVGKSAAHDARVFFDKGEGLTTKASCTTSFGYGKSSKKEDFTAISAYCISGTSVSDGACK